MKKLLTFALLLCLGLVASAQQEAKMLRFPTIHGNDVVSPMAATYTKSASKAALPTN